MTDQPLFLGALWGTILGLFYFGGLWLTVRRVQKVRRPKRLLLLSFFIRLSALLTCLWLILKQNPVTFATTLLFFFVIRFALTGLINRPVRRDMHAN